MIFIFGLCPTKLIAPMALFSAATSPATRIIDSLTEIGLLDMDGTTEVDAANVVRCVGCTIGFKDLYVAVDHGYLKMIADGGESRLHNKKRAVFECFRVFGRHIQFSMFSNKTYAERYVSDIIPAVRICNATDLSALSGVERYRRTSTASSVERYCRISAASSVFEDNQ